MLFFPVQLWRSSGFPLCQDAVSLPISTLMDTWMLSLRQKEILSEKKKITLFLHPSYCLHKIYCIVWRRSHTLTLSFSSHLFLWGWTLSGDSGCWIWRRMRNQAAKQWGAFRWVSCERAVQMRKGWLLRRDRCLPEHWHVWVTPHTTVAGLMSWATKTFTETTVGSSELSASSWFTYKMCRANSLKKFSNSIFLSYYCSRFFFLSAYSKWISSEGWHLPATVVTKWLSV